MLVSTYWLLSPVEFSELRLEDVMDRGGQFYRIWALPDHVAQKGEALMAYMHQEKGVPRQRSESSFYPKR